MLLANVLGLIFDNVPALVKQLGFIVYLLYNQMFEKALTIACNYLIIICVAAALYYHIRGLIAIHAENTALESQNSTSGEPASVGGDISHGWGLKNMEKGLQTLRFRPHQRRVGRRLYGQDRTSNRQQGGLTQCIMLLYATTTENSTSRW